MTLADGFSGTVAITSGAVFQITMQYKLNDGEPYADTLDKYKKTAMSETLIVVPAKDKRFCIGPMTAEKFK